MVNSDLISPSSISTPFVTNSANDYTIYIAGSMLKAINGNSNVADITNTNLDWGATVNACIAALPNGGIIHTKTGNYATLTPISNPVAASTPKIILTGVPSNSRGLGTTIGIGSTFPNQRYMIEGIAAPASAKSSSLTAYGFFPHNVNFARSGTSNQNILGGSTVIDAGFVKIESDNNIGIPVEISDITTQYLWRGVHFVGYLYWPVIQNYMSIDNNPNVVTDTHIIMEKGGHTDYPKGGRFDHIILNSTAGSASGTGSVNNAAVFGGAYHVATDIFTDGTKYNNSVFAFMQCFSSTFYNLGTIDLLASASQPATCKGTFLFDSNDFSGNVADTTHATYDNIFDYIYGSPANFTLAFRNQPFRNRIKIFGYWGGPATIDDTAAGIENVVEIVEGQQPVATPNTKIVSNSGLVKIIDRRVGAENKGTSTQTAVAAQKVYTIPHLLFAAPANVNVFPLTADADGSVTVTADNTNITLTYAIAPPASGSNNLKWFYYASVY